MSNNQDSKVFKIKKDGKKVHVEGIGDFESTRPHTLHLNVENLQISDVMADLSDENNPSPPRFRKSIHGSAIVDRDLGLGVIGYDHTHTKKVSIDIYGLDKDEIKKMNSERIKTFSQKDKKDSDGKNIDVEKILDISGSEKLYTFLSLDFSPRNWEFGTEDHFFASIYLANELFEILVDKIRLGDISGLSLGFDVNGLYTKDKVPFINTPIRFNFLPDEKEVSSFSASDMGYPPTAYGFVSLLRIFEKKRNFVESKLLENPEYSSDADSEKNNDYAQNDSIALLKHILTQNNALNKTFDSIKIAIWVAVIAIVLSMLI
jgi:hypothetical protein